jgi:hypothetical protein
MGWHKRHASVLPGLEGHFRPETLNLEAWNHAQGLHKNKTQQIKKTQVSKTDNDINQRHQDKTTTCQTFPGSVLPLSELIMVRLRMPCMRIYVHTRVCMYVCMYVYIYNLHLQVYVYILKYICIYDIIVIYLHPDYVHDLGKHDSAQAYPTCVCPSDLGAS